MDINLIQSQRSESSPTFPRGFRGLLAPDSSIKYSLGHYYFVGAFEVMRLRRCCYSTGTVSSNDRGHIQNFSSGPARSPTTAKPEACVMYLQQPDEVGDIGEQTRCACELTTPKSRRGAKSHLHDAGASFRARGGAGKSEQTVHGTSHDACQRKR